MNPITPIVPIGLTGFKAPITLRDIYPPPLGGAGGLKILNHEKILVIPADPIIFSPHILRNLTQVRLCQRS